MQAFSGCGEFVFYCAETGRNLCAISFAANDQVLIANGGDKKDRGRVGGLGHKLHRIQSKIKRQLLFFNRYETRRVPGNLPMVNIRTDGNRFLDVPPKPSYTPINLINHTYYA